MRNVLVSVLVTLAALGATAPLLAGGKPPPGQEDYAGDPNAPTAPFDLTDPKHIEAGKGRFHSTCADFCHGHEPALFIGRQLEPSYIFQVIVNGGRGATPMPPWGDVFTSEEIWELVAYLEFLGKQKAK